MQRHIVDYSFWMSLNEKWQDHNNGKFEKILGKETVTYFKTMHWINSIECASHRCCFFCFQSWSNIWKPKLMAWKQYWNSSWNSRTLNVPWTGKCKRWSCPRWLLAPRIWGSEGIAPRILNLGTRRRWVVRFTPRPLYPRRKNPGAHWIGGWVGGQINSPRHIAIVSVSRGLCTVQK
jgi:hypothetical protein